MIELEPDPAGQQRHDELVEANALLSGLGCELGVQAGRHSDEELAAGFHAEKIPHTVLTDDTVGGIVSPMLKYSFAPQNNSFHGVGGHINGLGHPHKVTTKSEKGERLEKLGNGRVALYIDGRFIANIPEEDA